MHFMAVEAAAQLYLFPPTCQTLTAIGEQRDPKRRKIHQYCGLNHLHDLESLWWVAAWIIFNNGFSRPEDCLDNLEETSNKTRLNLLHYHRRDSFTTTFLGMVDHVPDPQNEISYERDYLRELLLEQYWEVKSKLPLSINLDASDNSIYSHFKTTFVSL